MVLHDLHKLPFFSPLHLRTLEYPSIFGCKEHLLITYANMAEIFDLPQSPVFPPSSSPHSYVLQTPFFKALLALSSFSHSLLNLNPPLAHVSPNKWTAPRTRRDHVSRLVVGIDAVVRGGQNQGWRTDLTSA